MPSIPVLNDYDVSPRYGFLPNDPPLRNLPDPSYQPWEYIVDNLQGLMLSKRIRQIVDNLPILSTDKLSTLAEWRRAHCVLAFVSHAYIWGGNKPAQRVPPAVAIPFLSTCRYLELPPVATFAGVCLWNWKPIFESEPYDTLANLDIINTFTGSLDEKWFYIISVAIEAKGGPMIPLMLDAVEAANRRDVKTVTSSLGSFAEALDDICATLVRMYDECDPHVFYHRIRPYLAGSKNMSAAGLPNGVIFDDGGPVNKQRYVQYSGGSNAQSSLLQFFDLILGIEHRATGDKKPVTDDLKSPLKKGGARLPSQSNFILEMRKYMPGKHARFLAHVAEVANIRPFVQAHADNKDLCLAFDACVTLLSTLRDKHIQLVSRYIVIKSREAPPARDENNQPLGKPRMNLALRPSKPRISRADSGSLKGTGGSTLIPLLRQARDETGEPAIGAWAQKILAGKGKVKMATAAITAEDEAGQMLIFTAAATADGKGSWKMEDSTGGLCSF